MKKIKYNCSQVNELFSLMLDNELSGEDTALVEEHLLTCERCRNEYEIWQRISSVLKEDEISQAPSPDFSAKVIQRLEKEAQTKRLWTIPWRTPAAVAVAAVMLFTGSWGISLALKANKPETAIVQQDPNKANQQAGKEDNTSTGAPGVVNQGEDAGTAQQGTGSENEGNAKDAVNKGTKTAPPKVNNQAEVFSNLTLLSNNNKNIVTTILKLSVPDVEAAKEKVMSMAARQGGSSQVLAAQKTANSELVIVRVDVSRESGVGLAAQLAVQGVLTSRTEDRKDISDSYNKALNRLNEIQYLLNQSPSPADRSQLEAEASGLKRQIEVWNSEASIHGIIVWLQK